MPSAVSPEKTRKKTRIARLFVPADLKDSALLPSDPWIIGNATDIFKTDRNARRGLGRIGAFAALSVLAAAAAVTVMLAAAPVFAAVGGAAALVAAGVFAQKARSSWKTFKKEVMPRLRAEIAVRYINLKGAELRSRWKDFFFRKNPSAAENGAAAEKKAAEKKPFDKKPSQPLSALFDKEAFKKVLKEAQLYKDVLPPNKQPPSTPPQP